MTIKRTKLHFQELEKRLHRDTRDVLLQRLMSGLLDPDELSGQVVKELVGQAIDEIKK